MDRVPGTEKSELDKLNEELALEEVHWNRLGMTGNMTVHPPESIWVMRMQVQAMMNIILISNLCTEDELNIEFKKLMLTDMRKMREQVELQRRQAIVPKGIEVPNVEILGKDGRPIKF
jgi:hypothetical protein